MIFKKKTIESDSSEVKYASFTYRMLASVIDNILSMFVLIPFFNAVNAVIPLYKPSIVPSAPTWQDLIIIFNNSLPSMIFQGAIVAIIVILFWICKSATPGKMVLRMKIVDAKTGGKPSNMQMIARYFGYIASVLPLCAGFIWIYYDKKKQGFHDKIAGTVVIRY